MKHGGQKISAEYFSRAERSKKVVNMESYTQWKYPLGIKEKSRPKKKKREFVNSTLISKEWLKEIFSIGRKWLKKKNWNIRINI